MTVAKELMKRLMERFGGVIDLKEQPEALDEIVNEVFARIKGGERTPLTEPIQPPSAAPFGVSWMDSWVAHWVYADNAAKTAQRDRELASVLEGLADLRFRERLDEIRRVLQEEPPDGGTPEPGAPPAAPAAFSTGSLASEPGVPPSGPSGAFEAGAPDGGPPEPGTPPAGPAAHGSLAENPWILYWFVSLKAPALLSVIDLHLTRRLESLRR